MKHTLLMLLGICATAAAQAQMKLGNAPATVQTGQLLQLEKNGTRAGLKIAEVALTGTGDVTTINIPTTAVGTLIWNTATAGSGGTAVTPGFYVWNGTAWDRVATSAATTNLYTGDGTLAAARTVTQGTNNLTFGSTATTTTAQNLNANSLTTGTAKAITANALTTGTALSVTTSSNSLNSTNGLLQVANTGTSTNGILARLQSNATAGSGMTVTNSGNVGIGTATPGSALQIVNDATGDNSKDDITINSFGTGVFPGIGLYKSNGTVAAPANMTNNQTQGGIYMGGRVNNAVSLNSGITSTYKGNGTTNLSNLQFATSDTTRMTIDEDGDVGIGTTTPGFALNIVNNGGADAKDDLVITSYGSGINPGLILGTSDGTASAPTNLTNGRLLGGMYIGGRWNGGFSYPSSVVSSYRGNGTTNLSDLQFETSDTTRMTINENGYVGIGTTTPNVALNIVNNGTGNDAKDDIQIYSYGSSTSPSLSMYNVNGTQGSPTNLTSGALLGGWFMGGRINGSTATIARILSNYRGNGTTNLSDLQFSTSGTTTRMIIDENGDVGIGTLSPAYKLHVIGDINASGIVRANGVALTSDARLKRNVTNTAYGLATVMQLRPVQYEKKASIESTDYDHKEIGFIAQELRKVLPTIVQEGKDADKTLTVSYTELIPVLTKAIQEQQAQINELKAEIERLKK